MRAWLLSFTVAVTLLTTACGAATVPAPTITDTTVPGLAGLTASMDVVEIDQGAQRLYAADRTDQGIDVFDTATNPASYTKTIMLPAAPSGLAIAPDLKRAFAGMSNGSVAIIDVDPFSSKPDTVIQTVPTGGKLVDLIDYSSKLHQVFASNGDQGTMVSIDATTGLVVTHFQVGHTVEQPRFNPGDGMLYVTSPDANALIKLDPASGTIKSTLKLSQCYPSGLAINPSLDQAVIACHDFVIRQNLRDTGDVEAFGQVTGGDVVSYDAAADRFLVAAPHASPSAVAMFGGNPIGYIASVTTGAGGNSAAYDEASRMVYTPETRSGKGGLAGFQAPTGGIDMASQLPSLGILGAIMLLVVLFGLRVARWADPIHRPQPEPRRERA